MHRRPFVFLAVHDSSIIVSTLWGSFHLVRMRRLLFDEWLPLIAIILLAAALRFYALGFLPPGLYHDEAYNGLDALSVISGQRPVFFEANNGREPFFIYLVAVGVALLGRTALAIRAVSAVLGTLTVPVTYAAGKELFGRRVGLAAAFFAATTFWTVNLSRVGFRAVSLPLFAALFLWALTRGIHSHSRVPFILAGAALGISFYTYLAARFLPLTIVLFVLYLLVKGERINWSRWALLAAAALMVALPLLVYALGHPEVLLGRSAQVSILSPVVNQGNLAGTLFRQVVRTLAMFNWRGDFVPRHNLPLRPVFDPLVGAFFLVGVLTCLRRADKSAEHALSLLFVGVMLLPTILAEGAPHFLRGVGILPALFFFPALGVRSVWRWLQNRVPRRATILLFCGVAALSSTLTVRDYFVRQAPSQATYFNFESGASELAGEINRFLDAGGDSAQELSVGARFPVERCVYLAEQLWQNWVSLRYLVPESAGLIILGSDGPAPAPVSNTMIAVWPYADYAATLSLLPQGRLISVRNGPLERGDLEKEARLLCRIYETRPIESVPSNINEHLEQGIELLGYELLPEGERTTLRLYWRATAAVDKDYSVFVHVRRNGQMVTQSDSAPAEGNYATHLWRPGDVVADDHLLETEVRAGSGLAVQVGMYLLETMTRLNVLSADLSTIKGDLITIILP